MPERRLRIRYNLKRLRGGVQRQSHLRNLDRWRSLVKTGDVPSLHEF